MGRGVLLLETCGECCGEGRRAVCGWPRRGRSMISAGQCGDLSREVLDGGRPECPSPQPSGGDLRVRQCDRPNPCPQIGGGSGPCRRHLGRLRPHLPLPNRRPGPRRGQLADVRLRAGLRRLHLRVSPSQPLPATLRRRGADGVLPAALHPPARRRSGAGAGVCAAGHRLNRAGADCDHAPRRGCSRGAVAALAR